ncbi:response regulator [Photobacterium frigidiphilum]|jgi:response regulator of citrate/malate metabolism|uniref:Response regulator n=1 Tax=Photobacterium frigidiphilum TaxID=264736 RepID=A0A2T3JHC5_9GAMM|nr:response regulator [Photobacterium frigidiphilum]PSU48352.1 response regulator [Photobacterium frigidiphilum]
MSKFLIIEDNKVMAEVLAQIIRKCITPKEIMKCSTIESAHKVLLNSKENITGIFLDLNIEKRLDGLELLAFIRNNYPTIPISIITSESDTETVKRTLLCKPQDYLIKPLSVAKVKRSILKFEENKKYKLNMTS